MRGRGSAPAAPSRADAGPSSERARAEIEAAILLVAGGHHISVVVANLLHSDEMLHGLQDLADAVGVSLTSMPRGDGRACDVVVRIA